MNVSTRLKAYLEYKNIAPYGLENECGISTGGISKQLPTEEKPQGSSIGSANLEKILSVCKDLSAEWLLRGVGEMLLDDKEQTGGENNKYFQLCKLLLENKQRDNELYSELAKLMRKE